MHYVLMIHASEARSSARSPAEQQALMAAYGAYTKALLGTGRAGDSAALEPTSTATCVQIRDGKRVVKDGPFAETREQLGGYYSLEATSEEEALAWAAKIPDAEGGTIEVRPLLVNNRMGGEAKPADPRDKKEYLFLIYDAESRRASMTEADMKRMGGGYWDFTASVKAAAQFVAGDQLDRVASAKSVSVEGQKRVVRDGPFAETREQLGGYYRLWAKDLDEAIALAARLPAAETGTVEIRPVMDTSKYM